MNTRAFTSKYERISRILINEVGVTDPIQTRLDNKPETPLVFKAIWDTGATNTAITNKVVQQLNLQPTGMIKVSTANGDFNANTYVIDLWLPNKIRIAGLKVNEGTVMGADLLIGMDVMNLGDFSVSNFDGKTIFSFRIPSLETTDYVAIINNKRKVVSRNDPCPCGSGKKYKKCCGRQ